MNNVTTFFNIHICDFLYFINKKETANYEDDATPSGMTIADVISSIEVCLKTLFSKLIKNLMLWLAFSLLSNQNKGGE